MSLSENQNIQKQPFRHGKIILGSAVGGPVEVTLSSLEGPHVMAWNETTSKEYMLRVREKAKNMALEIANKAKAEAEEMRRQAWEQGYAEGQNTAAREFEDIRRSTEEALAEALDSINKGAKQIWNEHRRELTALVSAAVEKIIGLEISLRSRDILEKLMDQAVEAVDMRRMLTIKVHPDSHTDINDLMLRLKESHPQLGGWKVRSDSAMTPGGIIVASDSGLVDNSIEGRLSMLREVLNHLNLADETQELEDAEEAAPEAEEMQPEALTADADQIFQSPFDLNHDLDLFQTQTDPAAGPLPQENDLSLAQTPEPSIVQAKD